MSGQPAHVVKTSVLGWRCSCGEADHTMVDATPLQRELAANAHVTAAARVVIEAHTRIDPAALRPSTVVRRWTEPARGGVRAPMPCHEDDGYAVVVDPHAWAGAVAICAAPTCPLAYRLLLVDDGDGGWTAEFTVTDAPYLLARRRR